MVESPSGPLTPEPGPDGLGVKQAGRLGPALPLGKARDPMRPPLTGAVSRQQPHPVIRSGGGGKVGEQQVGQGAEQVGQVAAGLGLADLAQQGGDLGSGVGGGGS